MNRACSFYPEIICGFHIFILSPVSFFERLHANKEIPNLIFCGFHHFSDLQLNNPLELNDNHMAVKAGNCAVISFVDFRLY